MIARVTQLESFRSWRLNKDQDINNFIEYLNGQEKHRMRVGTAFHEMLESLTVEGGNDVNSYTVGDFTFNFACDCCISAPQFAEVRAEKQYGPLLVTGKADAVHGNTVTDYKSTSSFNALNYLDGVQWRFYLDLFGADEFVWNVFVIKPQDKEELVFDVVDFHILKASRYPALNDDCTTLALDYYETMHEHIAIEQ